jgi:hypothetical protein
MLQYTILDAVKKPFVIYKDCFTNQCSLDPRRGKNNSRVMVISLPHSGVHLMQEILTSMDLYHVRVSLEKNFVQDYRFLSDSDRIQYSRLYDNYNFSINDTNKWITEGQHIHSRIKYDDETYCLLRDSTINMYLLKRNLRNCVVSHARQRQHSSAYYTNDVFEMMQKYIESPYYRELLSSVETLIPWFENETFEEIKFETLIGDEGKDYQYQTVMKLIEDCEGKHVTIDEVIDTNLHKKTFTYTGDLSNWTNYWNDTIEDWFVETGFAKYNKILGYE